MKIKTFCAVAMAVFATSFALADQGDVLITFSTPGPDTYADGQTVVVDGEWYALCWSTNAVFGGFKTDGSALVAGDEVILAAPLAKGGKCPFTAFEFARNAKYDSGKFSIFLLDTRDSKGNPATSREQVFVKRGTVATSVTKGAADEATAQAGSAVGGASVAWSAPTELGAQQIADTKGAEITSFQIVGANVQITVTNTAEKKAEGVSYENDYFVVRTGETVDKMNTYSITVPKSSSSETATFIVPQSKGKFFAVGTLAK